jgi:hypothetical protein
MNMRKAGGNEFRAIRIATWREDWPDKRDPGLKKFVPWLKKRKSKEEAHLLFLHGL